MKTKKEIPVCQDCLTTSDKVDYFLIQKHEHYYLSCSKCVKKLNLEPIKQYNHEVKSKKTK